jgi:hypothetical protein
MFCDVRVALAAMRDRAVPTVPTCPAPDTGRPTVLDGMLGSRVAVVYVSSTGDRASDDRLHVDGFPARTDLERWLRVCGPRVAPAGELRALELEIGTVCIAPLTFTPRSRVGD